MRILATIASASLLLAGLAVSATSNASAEPLLDATPQDSTFTLGRTFSSQNLSDCPGPFTVVQSKIQAGSPVTFTTPIGGVITSVTFIAANVDSHIRLVLTKTNAATPGHWTVVGTSPVLTGTQHLQLNTVPTRLPVAKGVTVGAYVIDHAICVASDNISEEFSYDTTFNPTTSTDFAPTHTTTGTLDLAATMEPDVDDDGYGDITQDKCTSSALTHDTCDHAIVPDTVFTDAPDKKGTDKKASASFISTVAGSSFECSLDGKAFSACTSPFSAKVDVGKHSLSVRATGPGGLVDPTPASVTFTVKKPKKKHGR